MKQVDPPLVIEDLVRFGEDRGFERGLNEGLERGLNEGLERGLNEGLKRGLDEGLERGIDEGGRVELRRSIVDLLDARGIVVSLEQRARIDAESDLDRLRMALRRAAVAKSAVEVLE